MNEEKIRSELLSRGYLITDNQIGNISSYQKLSSDLLSILSSILQSSEMSQTSNDSTLSYHQSISLTNEEKSKFPFMIEEPFTYQIPDISIRRKFISDAIFPSNKYPLIQNTPEMIDKLNQLYTYYDTYFFGGLISYGLAIGKGSVIFEISNRMTSTGGSCQRNGICTYRIKLSNNRLNKITSLYSPLINGLLPKIGLMLYN